MRTVGMILVMATIGCGGSSQYVYRPADRNGQVVGRTTVDLPTPPDAPRGDVQITALGVTRRAGGAGSALHLRFTVNNRGDDKPWRIDTREVTVFVNCGGRICSMHATQEGGAPALLELAEGQQQSVDLDFTLPPGLQSASRVPAFIVAWQVTTGSGALARRTGFRRERRNADGSAADEDEDIARDYPSSWMESGHAGR